MAGDVIRRRIVVRGTVQGVGFRYYANAEAARLGVAGFVRNLADGSVEVEVEGGREPVARFIEWARTGPVSASVDSAVVTECEPAGTPVFTVAF
ncbi:MAG: acylphosphatase [Actinomycetota bacterium]|nr:acylphosphatase [Actinomycetota bacterium]